MPGILPRPAVAFRLILRPQGWHPVATKSPGIGRILAQSGAISYKAAGGGPARGYSSQLIEATTR